MYCTVTWSPQEIGTELRVIRASQESERTHLAGCDGSPSSLHGGFQRCRICGIQHGCEQFTAVLEADDSVAQENPALFRMGRDDSCGIVVGSVCSRAVRLMLAHAHLLSS